MPGWMDGWMDGEKTNKIVGLGQIVEKLSGKSPSGGKSEAENFFSEGKPKGNSEAFRFLQG